MQRISWEIDISREGEAPRVLSRSNAVEQVGVACDLCINGLVKFFSLSKDAARGLDDRFRGIEAKLVSGSEGSNGQLTVLPLEPLNSNIVDLRSKQAIAVPARETPEVRVSLESVAEEATNLLDTLRKFDDLDTAKGISGSTAEKVAEYIEDSTLLVGAAMRIATSRRLLRYVILPNGILSDQQKRKLGFDEWYKQQIENRPGPKLPSSKKRAVRDNYADADVGIKNLRRTAWSPLFFTNLGIDPNEVVFYMTYRDVLSRNCNHTVTFNDPLAIILSEDTTRMELENLFNAKKTVPKLVKN